MSMVVLRRELYGMVLHLFDPCLGTLNKASGLNIWDVLVWVSL